MMDTSKGRYWDEGIQLVDGCTPCSPGCDHCWSAAQAYRLKIKSDKREITCFTFNRLPPMFNGEIICHPERLKRFNTRKQKVFALWNDLFHEDVPDEFIMSTFGAMAIDILQPCFNTYLVLTKRHKRVRDFFLKYGKQGTEPWPNVYLGLTVCNQPELDEKWPIFAQVPGKKFISIEPMLGEINLKSAIHKGLSDRQRQLNINYHEAVKFPDCIILGGETGHGARPLHPELVRSVRDQCDSAGVPFFFKGWGEWGVTGINKIPSDSQDFGEWTTISSTDRKSVGKKSYYACNGETVKEGVLTGWRKAFHIEKVGRNKAGRKLDGRTHDDLPWGGEK